MNMVILGAKIAMLMHKPKVYWKLRSRTHQKDTPVFFLQMTKAPHQPGSKKMRITFCIAKVAYVKALGSGCQ